MAVKVSPGDARVRHPLYNLWHQTWREALDVYEGAGGFLDPSRPYLVPHPREYLDHSVKDATTGAMVPNPYPSQPSPKLKMRRRLARYENVAATILDGVTGALFAPEVTRTFSANRKDNPVVREWWEDVDGRGTPIGQFLQDAWVVAAVFGHAFVLLEKDVREPSTQADTGLPRLCRYTPLDVIDWLVDDEGELTAVKLLEAEPRTSFADSGLLATSVTGDLSSTLRSRVRVVDQETWTLYDSRGKVIQSGAHGFGRLPIEILYGKRRPLTPLVGKSIIGDPALYIDMYNLTSEVREILRNQTFAVLNVPVGTDANASLAREQDMIGSQSGTANILFSSNPAQFISPQGENITAYHEHLDRLGRMIYRLASAPWESDSRSAESEGSRKIKREDQNQILMKYATELQRTDRRVLELVYRALYGDRWQAQQDADGVSIAYPGTFAPPDMEVMLTTIAEAVGLELGETATREMKKRATRVLLPDLTPEAQTNVDQEIDAMEVKTADQRMQETLQASAQRLSWHQGAQGNPAFTSAANG